MSEEKFISEVNTIIKFIKIYCDDKHDFPQEQKYFDACFQSKNFSFSESVCLSCAEHISYCIKRLEVCPHEQKPRCRNCPTPCYDKQRWKETAKIMRYSGMKLGLNKVKRKFSKLFGS